MFNLASSFRLRNKLKERIAGLSGAVDNAEFSKTTGTKENTNQCDGKTLAEAIAEVDSLMDLLRELNSAIEKANSVNRKALITLETLKAKIAFYEKTARQCRQFKLYEHEYDEQGERVKVEKEPLIDQDQITAILAANKKEKDALEEKISADNFSIAVDFDPAVILERL